MAARITNSIVNGIRWLAVAAVFMSFSAPMLADQYDDQMAAIKAEIRQQQSQISQLQGKQDTLENKIAILNAQIADTNAQLQLNQAKYGQLSEQLAAAEAKLAQKKEVLGESIRAIYLETNLTPIEMLASSNNFSEFVDRAQYLQSLKSSVEEAIVEVTALKSQLEQQRKEQAELIAQQQGLKANLSAQRKDVNNLLAETRGQEAQYQQLMAANKAKLAQVAEAQQRYLDSLKSSGGSFSSGGTGGYPWPDVCEDSQGYYWGNNGGCSDDGWGYIKRQCVSWVSYRRMATGFSQPKYWGNGGDWYDRVNWSVTKPQRGDIIAWNYSGSLPYGHVAFVESVSGNSVTYSQYNFYIPGRGWGLWSQATENVGNLYRPGTVGFIR